jgi:hypothetical protein
LPVKQACYIKAKNCLNNYFENLHTLNHYLFHSLYPLYFVPGSVIIFTKRAQDFISTNFDIIRVEPGTLARNELAISPLVAGINLYILQSYKLQTIKPSKLILYLEGFIYHNLFTFI